MKINEFIKSCPDEVEEPSIEPATIQEEESDIKRPIGSGGLGPEKPR